MAQRSNQVVDATAADTMLEGLLDRIEDPDPLLRFLGEEILDYEAEVFATGGFGVWAPLDPYTVKAKGSSRILVDTGGLLDELTRPGGRSVRVVGDAVEVVSDDPVAGYLARGARGMPKRDPAPSPPASRVELWAEDLLGFIVGGGRR